MHEMNEHRFTVLVGDIFDSQAQTLVNTVNCAGVMGRGIALEFKNRFPDMHKDYVERWERGEVKMGQPYCYALTHPEPSSACQQLNYLDGPGLQQPKTSQRHSMIINFPTKSHWKRNSRPEDIEKGLEYLKEHYSEWKIHSLAIPALGCGNGKLEWRNMGPILYSRLSQLNMSIELYAPHGTPANELDKSFLMQPVTEKPLTALS